MARLTITVNDDVLRRARICAAERGTSVNQLLREYLEAVAGTQRQSDAMKELLAMVARSDAGSGPEGRRWTREEACEV
jgi:plasmid stability protein